MNNDIRRVIIARGSDIDIRKIAIATGMIRLRRAGLLNCMRGVSSFEDVISQRASLRIATFVAAPCSAPGR